MRHSLEERLHIAEAIADDEGASDRDRLGALEFLARFGLGTTSTETDTDGKDIPRPGRLTPDESKSRITELLRN